MLDEKSGLRATAEKHNDFPPAAEFSRVLFSYDSWICDLFEYLGDMFLCSMNWWWKNKKQREMMMWNTAMNNCVMTFEMDFYVVP